MFRDLHYVYLDKAKIAYDDTTEDTYLTDLTDMALDCTDQCIQLIEEESDTTVIPPAQTSDEVNQEKRLKQIKREISVDEKFAQQLVDKLNEILNNQQIVVNDVIGSVKSHEDKLSETLANLDKSWKTLLTLVETDDVDDQTTTINDTRMRFQSVHTRAVELIEKHRFTTNEVARLADQLDSTSVTESVSTVNTKCKKYMAKPKDWTYPTFSRDIRQYACFKKDFKQIVEPFYDDDTTLVYVMKQNCLKGDPKALATNIDDMNTIWKRLNDKYGDTLDLVEVVIKQLQELPTLKTNDDTKFIHMVDTLEKGLLDLAAIDARQDIANAYTVKMIENKLSSQMYLVWLEKESAEEEKEVDAEEEGEEEEEGETKVSRFEKLYSFLICERKKRMKLMKRVADRPPPPPPPPPSRDYRERHNANGAQDGEVRQNPSYPSEQYSLH